MKILSVLILFTTIFTSAGAEAWERPGWGGNRGPGRGHRPHPPHHSPARCSNFAPHGLGTGGAIWTFAPDDSGMPADQCAANCENWVQWYGNWNVQYVCQRSKSGLCDVRAAPLQNIGSCDSCQAAICSK